MVVLRDGGEISILVNCGRQVNSAGRAANLSFSESVIRFDRFSGERATVTESFASGKPAPD